MGKFSLGSVLRASCFEARAEGARGGGSVLPQWVSTTRSCASAVRTVCGTTS